MVSRLAWYIINRECMKRIVCIFICSCLASLAFAQKDYTKLVNPFIGTGGHGHTYPGATMPFGMMQLSPDTRMADWDGSSGYHYSDSLIYGFSHTHLSGTGIPDYCDVLMMPFTGDVKWQKEEYRSKFSHRNEKAFPGYYEVLLDKHRIKAQLTTSLRAGMHQYSFPRNEKQGAVLIDLAHRDQVLESWIEKISPYEIRGFRRSKSWAQDQHLYFHIRFEKPMTEFIVRGDEGRAIATNMMQGKEVKAFARFALGDDKMVRAKVGISAVSAEGARLNLDAELKDWNLGAQVTKARNAWNHELSRIDVEGGTEEEMKIFYTALYHTMLAPNVFQDVNGMYRGTDGRVRKASGFTNFTVFSLWDTYRALHPLMSMIDQKRTTDWINTFLWQYKNGGMLPVWELAGNETFCMIGYHSVPVIVDAWQKGVRGFDTGLALEAMRSYAESDRFGLKPYREKGFISNDEEHESVSKTLEYAYDDWCIGQFAKWTGNDSVFRKYNARAQNYKNLFDPSTGHMRGKVQGIWYSPFKPAEVNNFFTEGNSWQYSFYVPQDITGLMALHGGKEAFAKKLDELFTTTEELSGREQPDVTGLIGQYAHGNEPSHHMAYLYNFAGQPWKTQELVSRICKEFYKNAPDGLIGNEDCGQMSAWYVFSALGFYPVTPGNGEYVIGTPLFPKMTIRLENGKKFVVTKKGKTGAQYISTMRLNGNDYKRYYLFIEDMMRGGSLEFNMRSTPDTNTTGKRFPIAGITGEQIVAAPYFTNTTYKFRDSVQVELKHLDPSVELHYAVTQGDETVPYRNYERPVILRDSGMVWVFAEKNGKKSRIVRQKFHKMVSDRSITVLSKVHPMYTAGGPDALIDGIIGTTNWRTGEWQSYFDTDLEAIIDLKQERKVSYVGAHLLQDPSPWILYPSEIIFYLSNDGINFTELVRVKNAKDQDLKTIETQTLGTEVNATARYIKVKAVNAGKLPSWHESAGNPSHLFVDEIIIR